MCHCVFAYSVAYYCILTVRDTLILDLQVLVRSGAGVWEDVDPCHHHTLSSVVTSEEQNGRVDEKTMRSMKLMEFGGGGSRGINTQGKRRRRTVHLPTLSR